MELVPDVFKELSDYLRENYNGKVAAGGKEIVIRCPFCGDSKNLADAHLYIGVNKKANDLICYNCFRCGNSGTVTGTLFRELRCTELQLISDVLDYNKVRLGKLNHFNLPNRSIKPIIRYTKSASILNLAEKLAYINSRLGVQLTLDDLANMKIIMSLRKYLFDNHIAGITRSKEVMDEIDGKCIGFLSVDNSYVVNRIIVDPKSMDSLIKQRYINYRLYKTRMEMTLYYVIPNTIDVMKDITLHMAEGAFDILGVYFHVAPDHANAIYMATANKMGFLAAFKYIISFLKLVPEMISLHVYFDKEDNGTFNIYPYKSFLNTVRPWVNSLTVHINEYPGEKDFGVSGNRIIDTIILKKILTMKNEINSIKINTDDYIY